MGFGSSGSPTFLRRATAHLLADQALAVLTVATRGFVGPVCDVHFHYGQVSVVLAVVPAAGLVRHQHLSAVVRIARVFLETGAPR